MNSCPPAPVPIPANCCITLDKVLCMADTSSACSFLGDWLRCPLTFPALGETRRSMPGDVDVGLWARSRLGNITLREDAQNAAGACFLKCASVAVPAGVSPLDLLREQIHIPPSGRRASELKLNSIGLQQLQVGFCAAATSNIHAREGWGMPRCTQYTHRHTCKEHAGLHLPGRHGYGLAVAFEDCEPCTV